MQKLLVGVTSLGKYSQALTCLNKMGSLGWKEVSLRKWKGVEVRDTSRVQLWQRSPIKTAAQFLMLNTAKCEPAEEQDATACGKEVRGK